MASCSSAPARASCRSNSFCEHDQYILNADLPGIDPGSVDVDVDGQLLTIRAQRTQASQEGAKWMAQERPHGTYLRQFSLGEGVDAERITAHYDNGVLSVIIPVSEKAKPRRSRSPRPPRALSDRQISV